MNLNINQSKDKQKFSAYNLYYFLPIILNIGFGCSKEPSHLDGSFEYPQHIFWLRNKKIVFCYAFFTKGLYIGLLLIIFCTGITVNLKIKSK